MNPVFEAYDVKIGQIMGFYKRIIQPITYPDGMVTSLGIIYWVSEKNIAEIENALPRLKKAGLEKLSEIHQVIKTKVRAKKFTDQSGIPMKILRVLKHDIDLWLPKAVDLDQIECFRNDPQWLEDARKLDLNDQLQVISSGQTPYQRTRLSDQMRLDRRAVDEMVRMCDFYRMGSNLDHIRSKMYYRMGMDTWQKWAHQDSATIIALFTQYIHDHPEEEERLVPWPKEVRNGIEWAKMHLDTYAVEWESTTAQART